MLQNNDFTGYYNKRTIYTKLRIFKALQELICGSSLSMPSTCLERCHTRDYTDYDERGAYQKFWLQAFMNFAPTTKGM